MSKKEMVNLTVSQRVPQADQQLQVVLVMRGVLFGVVLSVGRDAAEVRGQEAQRSNEQRVVGPQHALHTVMPARRAKSDNCIIARVSNSSLVVEDVEVSGYFERGRKSPAPNAVLGS